jgi:radical SAM superfamily enzyme YgiQ (UPF0313 family)
MKKILLVQPKVGSWEFIQSTPMLPLALLSISAFLAKEYDIRIIDQRLDPRWASTLQEELGEGEVVCVGVTTMTGPQIAYALEGSKIVKENSNVPVVWGGIHPSILPEQTIRHSLVDIVIAGEGEFAFRDLVHAIDKGQPYGQIRGVWTAKDGEAKGSLAEAATDVDQIPPLPYHLVNVGDYVGFDRDGRKKFPVKTSRGCPGRCTFCHQTSKYRKKWRALTPDRVLDEIDMLKVRYGVQHFQIVDDNFFVDSGRAHEILQRLAEKQSKDTVFTINGARITDIIRLQDETLKLLSDAGCYEVQIGLESGSQHVLDHMKKDITIAQVFEVNERLKKYGIPRYYQLVSGFRDETVEDMSETSRVILELSKSDPNVFFSPLECLTPYPGTEVYTQAVEAGMRFPETLEGWSAYQWDKAQLPWLDGRRKRLLESFHIYPTFISSKIKTIGSPVLKAVFRAYRPIARFRVKTLFFGMPVEAMLFKIVSKVRS